MTFTHKLPNIVVAFSVLDKDGEAVHTGKFRLRNTEERRAFGERCNEALAGGYEVRTWRDFDAPRPRPKNYRERKPR